MLREDARKAMEVVRETGADGVRVCGETGVMVCGCVVRRADGVWVCGETGADGVWVW